MLLELIDKILVHERDVKGSINCSQEIEIYFNFIGRYLPPDFVKEPTAEELEAIEIERKKKEKAHAAYLRRKESGWQKAYEARVKAEKKAKIEAMKEEIRQEEEEKKVLEKENDRQRAVQELKQKYGKNAVFLATSLEEGATGRQRNEQIGGHKK